MQVTVRDDAYAPDDGCGIRVDLVTRQCQNVAPACGNIFREREHRQLRACTQSQDRLAILITYNLISINYKSRLNTHRKKNQNMGIRGNTCFGEQ